MSRITGVVLISLSVASCPIGAQERPVFRSTVVGVSVPVRVQRGRQPVRDLKTGEFQLTDSGVSQDITAVDAATVPLDITVVAQETELIQSYKIGTFAAEVQAVARSVRPGDDFRVLLTGDDQREQDLPLRVDSVGQAKLEEQCHPIYDGLARALIRPTTADRQRVIILISIGEGSGSVLSAEPVIEIARRSNATVYVVTMEVRVGQTTYPSWIAQRVCPSLEVDWSAPRQRGLYQIELIPSPGNQYRQLWLASKNRLVDVATQTGGREIRSTVLTNSVGAPLREALDELRSGYVLRYTPTGVPETGWHPIRVTVKREGEYAIRVRPGYQR